ncbi:Ent-kaurene synthase [Hypoxylon trugodes]|uniref:Ent-kaurene synthase n=1 Tax=Hypoxylon trugodes TaxID=326681 RepID=UPI00219BB1C5|nr:Ent-kaurene synthase [Hypoxylon trugodes]KAI1384134.1 Ent-kaurene synthase [Hypoxylon trugodes]
MSVSVYDTAWLSMLQKPGDSKQWLFPECFDYILRNQLEDGSWPSYASVLDGVLNTAAALLAVRKHLSHDPKSPSLQEVSFKAEVSLTELIRGWDVFSCDQVGYEILVTAHLSLLKQEGVALQVPQIEQLESLRELKLSRLPASLVYKGPSALYHSLEGLIGHIDFDNIAQWREPNGSMMGSPSSTAAYLMNISTWDDHAETYLRDALRNGSGQGCGGVPSAWPSSIFEVSWTITTLAESNIPIGEVEASTIGGFLETSLRMQKGIVGFAPGSLADADDTAKCAMSLLYLGREPKPYIEALIHAFETADHFQTYLAERNPSLSTNINVLSCLLLIDDPLPYVPQVAKAASFICKKVFVGDVKEKWHIHRLYWMMLLSKAVVLLYKRMQENETFRERLLIAAPNLKEQILILSLQIVMTILKMQNHGNWEEGCELTAYAVLALSSFAQLPLIAAGLRDRIYESINQGKVFLAAHRSEWRDGAYLWTEKVTYSSEILSEAYCLAATVNCTATPTIPGTPPPFQVSEKILGGMSKAGHLISCTPLFNQADTQLISAAQLQACYALSDLKRRRLDIFPRTGMGEDKYLIFIPLTWTACMSLREDCVSLAVLSEMMVLSMLNYQVDEYMEDVLERGWEYEEGFQSARDVVRQLFVQAGVSKDSQNETLRNRGVPLRESTPKSLDFNGNGNGEANGHKNYGRLGMKTVLSRYIAHILQHPSVLKSTQDMQVRLARELETFLLAHIDQAEDNSQFARQLDGSSQNSSTLHDETLPKARNGIHNKKGEKRKREPDGVHEPPTPASYPRRYRDSGRTFYKWVRSTSADHTSCPFSFVFFHCLLFATHGDVAGHSAKTAYLVEDACRHLASLCRMYNDYGSLARDADELNLNSLNFPEFARAAKIGGLEEKEAKEQLMNIAEYERRSLNLALNQLESELMSGGGGNNGKWMDAIRLFVNVTDLCGQIYVVKDIATRK